MVPGAAFNPVIIFVFVSGAVLGAACGALISKMLALVHRPVWFLIDAGIGVLAQVAYLGCLFAFEPGLLKSGSPLAYVYAGCLLAVAGVHTIRFLICRFRNMR
jgi:hypothetical protein